jgi:hypothetical protein
MINLNLVERQPHWRVWLVAWFSRIMGVCIHVEGIPFGSSRLRKKRTEDQAEMGAATGRQIGGTATEAANSIGAKK